MWPDRRTQPGSTCACICGSSTPELPIILFTGAWEGVDADREVLERKADAVLVFKEVRDRERDDLAARVRALLAKPRVA